MTAYAVCVNMARLLSRIGCYLSLEKYISNGSTLKSGLIVKLPEICMRLHEYVAIRFLTFCRKHTSRHKNIGLPCRLEGFQPKKTDFSFSRYKNSDDFVFEREILVKAKYFGL